MGQPTLEFTEQVGSVHVDCQIEANGYRDEDSWRLIITPVLDEGVDDGTLEDDERRLGELERAVRTRF